METEKVAKRKTFRCRICKTEFPYNIKYCNSCKFHRENEITDYKLYLESKRRFVAGNVITTIDELMTQDLVFWRDKITNQGWLQSSQLRWICNNLKAGHFRIAIKKDGMD